jgi:hypothetical protein
MKPKRFFFVVLGIGLVILAASGYGYYWARQQLVAQSGALGSKLAMQHDEDQQIAALQHTQLQYNREIVPILELIDEALPRDKKQTEILAQLQNIASSTACHRQPVCQTPCHRP